MTTFSHFLPVSRVFTLSLTLGSFLAGSVAVQAAPSWRMRSASARSVSMGFAAEPGAADTLRPADRAFLSKSVESCRQQKRLAEIGVSQAGNSDVRSHALQLVTDYRSLNDALEALVRRKGGTAGAAPAVSGPSETYQKLAQLSGRTFDREFVRMVGRMGDEVMASFEQAVSESKDSDVRELAAAQLPMLRAHQAAIAELKKLIE